MTYADRFLGEARRVLDGLDPRELEALARALADVRARGGRLFFLGVGGGASQGSHAAADFRKLAGIEAYAAVDNVSELTARVNDDGWESVFVEFLRASRLNRADAVFVFSVGGGSLEPSISENLVHALELAKETGAAVFGVVGRDGGYTAAVADACVLVPVVEPERITAHTETVQALILHYLVTHPLLQLQSMKWESVSEPAAASSQGD